MYVEGVGSLKVKCVYCGKSWSVSFLWFIVEYYLHRGDDGVYIKHFRCHNCGEDNCYWIHLRMVKDTVRRHKKEKNNELFKQA